MPRYLIERELPGAGRLPMSELQRIAQTSCGVLQSLGHTIQWVHSYVTDDKITCVYIAPNADLIREHARRGGFPVDAILQIRAVIDPISAETPAAA